VGTHEERTKVLFRREFAAVNELEALNVCVLGRDVTGLFAGDLDDYDPAAGARFLADVRAAFNRLTTFPGLGPL